MFLNLKNRAYNMDLVKKIRIIPRDYGRGFSVHLTFLGDDDLFVDAFKTEEEAEKFIEELTSGINRIKYKTKK